MSIKIQLFYIPQLSYLIEILIREIKFYLLNYARVSKCNSQYTK